MIESCGPVTVCAQSTRMPLIRRVETPTPRDYIYRFRLTRSDEPDEEMKALPREAYQVRCQEPKAQ